MGCIARLGCLVILAILCVIGWFTRDRWLPDRFRSTTSAAAGGWEPVTEGGAERTRQALDRLSQPRGPVFQTLSAGDVASLAFTELGKRVSGAADSVAAKIDGDRMSMRASVRTADIKGRLGPLAAMVRDRENVELTGTFAMLQPGLGMFKVQEAKLGAISLPQGMIPRLVKEVDRGRRPDGFPDTALPLPVPSYVSDIRIANGKVTLYKNVK